jgi:hypothetical protein
MAGYWQRFGFAFRTFFSILDYGGIPADVAAHLLPGRPAPPGAAPVPVQPAEPGTSGLDVADRAVQLLALFQRDGRLVDFLMEDLAGYPDAQVGAAARDVHAGCRQALARYVTLEAILDGAEDQPVTVEPGLDPAAIRLIGRIAGRPPFRGLLRHRGWRAAVVELPPLPEGEGRRVIAPAEVEVS